MSSSVPEGWQYLPMSQVAVQKKGSIVDGPFGSNLKTSDYVSSGIPVLQGKNITNNKFKWFDVRYINKKKANEIIRSSVRVGDILLVKIGSVGYAAIVDNLNDYPYAIIPANLMKISVDEENYATQYVFQYLSSPEGKQRLIDLASSTAQPALSLSIIKNYKLPIPPLPEQKKIAAILTSVDTVIEKTQAQIDKLKDLKTGIMQELLTKGIGHTEFKDSPVGRIPVEWEVKDLGDLAFKIEGGGTPPRKNPDYWGKGYPWATVKDLKSIRLSSTEESITKTGLINSSSKLVPAGTVILATRMAVGKAVVFDCDVTINQDLKAFYPKEKLNNKFLLQWYLYKSKYIASLGTGSTVKGIRVDDLKLLIIAVPPYDEQIIIANKIEGIEVLLNHKIAKIQKMTSLKKALMQDLLTGKVRVKV